MQKDNYTRETAAIIDTLTSAKHEIPIEELLFLAKVDLFVAPTVIGELIKSGRIAYRMSDGTQMFRINGNNKISKTHKTQTL